MHQESFKEKLLEALVEAIRDKKLNAITAKEILAKTFDYSREMALDELIITSSFYLKNHNKSKVKVI